MKELKKTLKEYQKLSLFIDQYNWKDIEFPLHSKDWKKFEQNNRTIDLNILFVSHNTKQIRQAYISKYNHERDNLVILLMIADDNENRHYLAVKSISKFLRGITSNHNWRLLLFKLFSFIQNKRKT